MDASAEDIQKHKVSLTPLPLDMRTHATPHRGYTSEIDKRMPLIHCRQLSASANENRVRDFSVKPCTARAWRMHKGQTCTFYLPYGAQVGDINIWNADDTSEHFYSGKTRQIHRAHLSTGDHLWSNLPHLRPLATIIEDSLEGYTPDSNGCGVNDVLGTRCDPYTHRLATGKMCAVSCHQLCTKACELCSVSRFQLFI